MPEKVNSSGNRKLCHHNFNFVVYPSCLEPLHSSRRDVLKNIFLLDFIFSFSNYRPLPIPEVTLLSSKTALKFPFR